MGACMLFGFPPSTCFWGLKEAVHSILGVFFSHVPRCVLSVIVFFEGPPPCFLPFPFPSNVLEPSLAYGVSATQASQKPYKEAQAVSGQNALSSWASLLLSHSNRQKNRD